ncbi:MAG: triose-phosphate isomerase [bacterium]|nr:triose-phosphate isomerase [bacterium]
MRRILIAGNWKMNVIDNILPVARAAEENRVDVAVFPPFVYLERIINELKGSKVVVGAQNMHHQESGPYTGETSPKFLLEMNVKHVIIGHSERRHVFKESDEEISLKMKKALSLNMNPILCVGETESERLSNKHKSSVENQLKIGLGGIENNLKNIIIAYEPVWAIGTGNTATPNDAEEMHSFIREQISYIFGRNVASEMIVLYGGSVNEENVKDLLRKDNIDGALVGGASLKGDKFAKIIEIGGKTNI